MSVYAIAALSLGAIQRVNATPHGVNHLWQQVIGEGISMPCASATQIAALGVVCMADQGPTHRAHYRA